VDEKVKPNMPNPSENFTEMLPGEVALEMISIPAGEFMMGSNTARHNAILNGDSWNHTVRNKNEFILGENTHKTDIDPVLEHKVYLQRFYIGKYPITQAQWMTLMEENSSQFKGKDHPVHNINMKKAQEFCQKLSEITGKRYQLPTEAQWEYACRAGSITKWHFGNDENQLGELGEYAWYKENSNKTCSVGQLKPNQWGLYDMYGNVWEWCQDYHWLSYYIPNLQAVDVTFNYHEYTILKAENILVRRGGNYLCTADLCCSANRNFSVELPIDADISALGEGTGFRIVCVP
jgi:formylglycine-generating enzyme required for sulfatase activity